MNTLDGYFDLNCSSNCEVSLLDLVGFRRNVIIQSAYQEIISFFDGHYEYKLSPLWKIWQWKSDPILINDLTDFCFINDRFGMSREIRVWRKFAGMLATPEMEGWIDRNFIIQR